MSPEPWWQEIAAFWGLRLRPEDLRRDVVIHEGSGAPASLQAFLLTPEGEAFFPGLPVSLRFPLPAAPAPILGRALAIFRAGEQSRPAATLDGATLRLAFHPGRVLRAILEEEARPVFRPVTAYFPVHYHLVPAMMRGWIGRALSRRPHRPEFPAYPVETAVESLRRLLLAVLEWSADGEIPPSPFWPEGKSAAVLLTHDLDSSEGLSRIHDFLTVENGLNLRSSWCVAAAHYELPLKFLDRVRSEGHEVACHDYNHDNRLPFLPEEEIARRLDYCRRRLAPFGTRMYRSASKSRSPALWRILPRYFDIDSSVPDTDDEGGCATIFPFERIPTSDVQGPGPTSEWNPLTPGSGYPTSDVGRRTLLEIPMTLPLDSSLLLAGCTPDQVLAAWRAKLAWIREAGGAAVLTTHPEPHFSGSRPMLRVYERFLADVAGDASLWVTTPSALADHWRARTGRPGADEPRMIRKNTDMKPG